MNNKLTFLAIVLFSIFQLRPTIDVTVLNISPVIFDKEYNPTTYNPERLKIVVPDEENIAQIIGKMAHQTCMEDAKLYGGIWQQQFACIIAIITTGLKPSVNHHFYIYTVPMGLPYLSAVGPQRIHNLLETRPIPHGAKQKSIQAFMARDADDMKYLIELGIFYNQAENGQSLINVHAILRGETLLGPIAAISIPALGILEYKKYRKSAWFNPVSIDSLNAQIAQTAGKRFGKKQGATALATLATHKLLGDIGQDLSRQLTLCEASFLALHSLQVDTLKKRDEVIDNWRKAIDSKFQEIQSSNVVISFINTHKEVKIYCRRIRECDFQNERTRLLADAEINKNDVIKNLLRKIISGKEISEICGPVMVDFIDKNGVHEFLLIGRKLHQDIPLDILDFHIIEIMRDLVHHLREKLEQKQVEAEAAAAAISQEATPKEVKPKKPVPAPESLEEQVLKLQTATEPAARAKLEQDETKQSKQLGKRADVLSRIHKTKLEAAEQAKKDIEAQEAAKKAQEIEQLEKENAARESKKVDERAILECKTIADNSKALKEKLSALLEGFSIDSPQKQSQLADLFSKIEEIERAATSKSLRKKPAYKAERMQQLSMELEDLKPKKFIEWLADVKIAKKAADAKAAMAKLSKPIPSRAVPSSCTPSEACSLASSLPGTLECPTPPAIQAQKTKIEFSTQTCADVEMPSEDLNRWRTAIYKAIDQKDKIDEILKTVKIVTEEFQKIINQAGELIDEASRELSSGRDQYMPEIIADIEELKLQAVIEFLELPRKGLPSPKAVLVGIDVK